MIDYVARKGFKGRTVSLKIKFSDFKVISRSKTFPTHVSDYEILFKTGAELLQLVDLTPKIRLIGIGVKNNEEEESWADAIQLRIKFLEDEM